MAWPKFGKTDEKKDDSQSKAEADALIDRIGTSIEERFKPKFEAVDTLLTKWNKMEEEATKQVTEETRRTEEDALTPEQKAANREKALFLMTVQANARITESECIAEVAGRWPQIIPELKDTFAKIDVARKATADYPGQCRNVVNMLVGKEAQKNGVRYDKDNSKFFIEDSAAKTGGADSPFSDPDLTWTDERSGKTLTASQQLEKLRIDPEKFAKFLKQGGRGIVQ
jgi:hypothetical protein